MRPVDLSGYNAGPLLRLGDRDDFEVTTSTGKLSLSSLYTFGSLFVALSNLDKFYVKNHVHNNFPRNFYILNIHIIERLLLRRIRGILVRPFFAQPH